ncbi:glycerate kinase type-2 family protein [Acetobacter syzygii]|uniref:glycerate kinase type-2 family protein n=1 Tax=Acetobacter syzygii TaxID=146476 RepID=UPI00156F802A|nr:glycerate kinase [Acetobacter syzygii]NSL93223.1 glycerate kinase [Acetobacter syzygii]
MPVAQGVWDNARARSVLRSMFDAAVASADPFRVLAGHLPPKPRGRCVVVGAGKASAAMAAALEAAWPDVVLEGVVVTRDGHAVPTRHVRILEASHPVPDHRSEVAAKAVMQAVQGLGPDDLVIALISGGGSSLLALPAAGLTLDDKRVLGKQLLHSGATIAEMNTVRRALSAIKGGRLALAASPAQVLTLVISDVPGDDPAVIASGPTVPPPGKAEDALRIVERYRLDLSSSVRQALERGVAEQKAQNGLVDPRNRVVMIATPLMALKAAADVARQHGITPLVLGDALEGESQVAGIVLGGMARSVHAHGLPVQAPAVLLSGGETTVTIRAGEAVGKGGRNTEFLLSCAQFLGGEVGIWGLAGDSDGIDGTEDAAGAIFAPDTLARAAQKGYMAESFLHAHDSYMFFKALDDLVMTGPTLTNVNDIRLLLIA